MKRDTKYWIKHYILLTISVLVGTWIAVSVTLYVHRACKAVEEPLGVPTLERVLTE